MDCFARRRTASTRHHPGFNIRSFGSWIASFWIPRTRCIATEFQYPLFRIVDCFGLSADSMKRSPTGFNIRSFGSWIASPENPTTAGDTPAFQYPLFRIVDCFLVAIHGVGCENATFQYPLFRIVDCFLLALQRYASILRVSISALSDRGLLPRPWRCRYSPRLCFNIRSFGSWIASRLYRKI